MVLLYRRSDNVAGEGNVVNTGRVKALCSVVGSAANRRDAQDTGRPGAAKHLRTDYQEEQHTRAREGVGAITISAGA